MLNRIREICESRGESAKAEKLRSKMVEVRKLVYQAFARIDLATQAEVLQQ